MTSSWRQVLELLGIGSGPCVDVHLTLYLTSHLVWYLSWHLFELPVNRKIILKAWRSRVY